MATGLIDIMKRASMDAIENNQMCDLRFGTVTSVSPLKVQITNLLTIPESLLIVPEKLTDYTVKVTLDWNTEYVPDHSHSYSGSDSDGDSCSGTAHPANKHLHQIISNEVKEITIHNRLKVGDKVVLMRKTGGQAYYILDRLPK